MLFTSTCHLFCPTLKETIMISFRNTIKTKTATLGDRDDESSSLKVTPAVDILLEKSLCGEPLTQNDCYHLIKVKGEDFEALCHAASTIRDKGKGRVISFSPKIFIPLTKLCRDFCNYCTFREDPRNGNVFMTPEEILSVVKSGEKLGCTEALFTLGERPEQKYPEASTWLNKRGYRTTLEYLSDMCKMVTEETKVLPHANPGTMSSREMDSLKDYNPSMGLMLESTSKRLYEPGGPHELAPSKRPKVRLKTIEIAGKLNIAFTTGILTGIGETLEDRVDSLFAIKKLDEEYGHIQEVIVQNFRSKPGTPMAGQIEPSVMDTMRTAAVTRLILGPSANIQVPPNLSLKDYPSYLMSGINDWGGISPITIDYVNPEAPWPQIPDLYKRTKELGFELKPRLPIYPEYLNHDLGFVPAKLQENISAISDNDGYVKGGIERYV